MTQNDVIFTECVFFSVERCIAWDGNKDVSVWPCFQGARGRNVKQAYGTRAGLVTACVPPLS